MKEKRFLIVTLGCFRNEVESDLLRSALVGLGMRETHSLTSADIVVINTCGFIAGACDEGIDTILELDELAGTIPDRLPLVAVGCMAQRYGEALMREMPELSGVLGMDWESELEAAVGTVLGGGKYAGARREPKTAGLKREVDSSENATLFVRASDGCDRGCLFCSIPSIRGPYASRGLDEISDEVSRLAAGREREVILLAQDLTAYGKDIGTDLPEMVRGLTALPEVRWLRLLYLQPEGVTTELIEEVAGNSKVCKYFDIPFQHASRRVLRAMGRPGDADEYLRLIESIRARIPDASVRSTVMVGYPGETDDDFAALVRFIEEARFDWLGGFVFSAEEGTAAAELPGTVDSEVALSRYNIVAEVQDRMEESELSDFEGRRLEVVVDGSSEIEPYDLVGRSYREAPIVDGVIYLVQRDGHAGRALRGDFVEALITGREGLDLVAEI